MAVTKKQSPLRTVLRDLFLLIGLFEHKYYLTVNFCSVFSFNIHMLEKDVLWMYLVNDSHNNSINYNKIMVCSKAELKCNFIKAFSLLSSVCNHFLIKHVLFPCIQVIHGNSISVKIQVNCLVFGYNCMWYSHLDRIRHYACHR